MKRQTSNVKRHLSKVLPYLGLLIATIGLLSCQLIRVNPPPPVPRPNVVIGVEGTAQVKREGWTAYSPVGFGALVQYADLLDVEGRVQILCGDLTVRTLASGRDNCPCPPWEGSFQTSSGSYRNIPQGVPYIQHPRNTLVLEAQPLLRWHDTGASGYTVAIVQDGEAIWQQAGVTGNEMVYPAAAPPLQPGMDYLLRVQAEDSGVSSEADPARGLGFQVMISPQQAALEAHCGKIAALPGLDAAARDYALALCYVTWEPEGGRRGPWGAAWLLLETVAQAHDAPTVHLWRGDLLRTMQLSADALAAYHVALSRAEALGDLESQAAAHERLYELTADAAHRDAAAEASGRLGK